MISMINILNYMENLIPHNVSSIEASTFKPRKEMVSWNVAALEGNVGQVWFLIVQYSSKFFFLTSVCNPSNSMFIWML